ncbi:hypothetical protein [Massilia sp. MS-15]|uniref:hypothetical protein n=1 Tax=Massilia sp. MS-15 TaxID=2878200 RepID=UPI001CD4D577|nr:hypothetical protein [Massilia sp. MS-15]MCA1247803.1 hypothetical protein [Massilia sp. MS-15]
MPPPPTLLVLPVLAACLLYATPARARPSADIPTVEVKATQARLLPYRELFYPLAKAVQQRLAGRAVLAMQLRPVRAGVRTDDLRLWLEGGGEALPLPPGEHGLFIVPVAERIAAHDGSFAINKHPADLRANLVLVPTLAPDAWTMGEVRRLLQDVHATIAPLMPWHHRLLMWAAARRLGVAVCSLSPSAQVAVTDGGQVLARYPTSEPLRNHANAPVYCHRFSGHEDFDAGARLVLPDDAQVLLI